jgi:hypothetical protein
MLRAVWEQTVKYAACSVGTGSAVCCVQCGDRQCSMLRAVWGQAVQYAACSVEASRRNVAFERE